MKIFISLFLFILGFSNSSLAQKLSAKELLSLSLEYHDPQGKLLQSDLTFDFIETRPNGQDRSTTVKCNIKKESFVILQSRDSFFIDSKYDKGEISFRVNGRDEISVDIKEKLKLNNDRLLMLRNYYQYLWLLPLKLEDPGTIVHEPAFLKDFFGTESWEIKVTYDPGVGNDIWYFYFHPKTYALVGYRFYHDEAANDGEYILLLGEQESNGVKIPKSRKWYTHKDDKFLGADILEGFWVE